MTRDLIEKLFAKTMTILKY